MKIFIISGLLLFITGINLSAQPISLKRSFLSYRFSTDGINYQGIGGRAFRLRKMMEKDEQCISLLDKYSSMHAYSIATGICGGLLIVYPVAVYAFGSKGEWEPHLTSVVVTGAVFIAAAVVFDILAASNLKKAVEKYNLYQTGSLNVFRGDFTIRRQFKEIRLGLKYPL